MVAELTNIKDYVLAEIGKIETDVSFLSELDTYLERMIAPVEGALNKGNFQLKAGRQLLCSIGIDIKSGLVPADHYLLIFKATNFSSYSKEARKLFFECVNDNKYFFRDSERKLTTNFCVVVFPIKDRDYYIDAHLTGIHSISTIDFMVNELVNYSKSNTIQLKSKVLDKRNDMRYFWTAPEPDIQAIAILELIILFNVRNVESCGAGRAACNVDVGLFCQVGVGGGTITISFDAVIVAVINTVAVIIRLQRKTVTARRVRRPVRSRRCEAIAPHRRIHRCRSPGTSSSATRTSSNIRAARVRSAVT